MRILGFDTATRDTAVALWDSERPNHRFEARDNPLPGQRPGHATRLLALIVELLGRAGIGWEEVDRIAVGVGPGTFTGLRIGVATARGLARSRGIPLVGVCTLRSLALNAPAESRTELVLAVLDARRSEVFAAGWRPDEIPTGRRTMLAPRAMAPEALAQLVESAGLSALAIGDGAVEFRSVLEHSGASVPDDDSDLHRVRAINHCRLAGGLAASAPDQIRPEYLRLPDAEIARRAADSN
jgi:tRNA threonylcarbamoyladenosine biosynthesis protein TsaB